MAFYSSLQVKIPSLLHLCKLGYTYLSLENYAGDEETNFLTEYQNTTSHTLKTVTYE